MADRKKENAVVVSQEQLSNGIFSMWLRTEAAETAKPGQFISMYTNDGTKLLPRPISICEIDKENDIRRCQCHRKHQYSKSKGHCQTGLG